MKVVHEQKVRERRASQIDNEEEKKRWVNNYWKMLKCFTYCYAPPWQRRHKVLPLSVCLSLFMSQNWFLSLILVCLNQML